MAPGKVKTREASSHEVEVKGAGSRRRRLWYAAVVLAAVIGLSCVVGGVVLAVAMSSRPLAAASNSSNATNSTMGSAMPSAGVVLLELVASGTVADYSDTSAIRLKVAIAASVSEERVSIEVRSASVIISALINVPVGNTTAAIVERLTATMGTAASASSFLGIEVLSSSILVVSGGPGAAPPEFLPPSRPDTLLRLQSTSTATGAVVTVGRSYDGHAWEGVPPTPITFTCYSAGCLMPAPPSGHTYRVVEVNGTGAPPTASQTAARFLTQATFGPTKADIDAFTTSSTTTSTTTTTSAWVAAQMALPPSLHRAHWRRRANPRQPRSTAVGNGRQACSVGSRWHAYAFTRLDVGKTLVATLVSAGATYQLSLDGVVRSEVAASAFTASALTAPYVICSVEERLGGKMSLGSACTAGALTNPSIAFTTPPASSSLLATFASSDASFAPASPEAVPDTRYLERVPSGEVLVATAISNPSACAALDDASTDLFMSFGGTFYRHDQRLSLLTNTLASPVSDASGASAVMACPTAPKTFVNRASCVGATTCAPTAYAGKLFQLNASTLRLFYTHANRVVYDIAGLRLEDPEDRDPCGGVETRWKRSSGACTSDTSLDSDSRSAIVAALQNATADSNPDVRDIIVSCGSAGGGGSAKGARLTVASDCWTHVHHDLMSVFDFTLWAREHPGSSDARKANRRNPIEAFAAAGGTTLSYPSHHLMSDWANHRNKAASRLYFTYVGRLGDQVDFKDLPSFMQSPEMASVLGAMSSGGGSPSREACGSPGEEANEPSYGNVYEIYQSYEKLAYADRRLEWLTAHNVENAKAMAWTMVSLQAADQLRQRMAWSLSQLLVVSVQGIAKRRVDTELWLTYYDILVRGAFGSFHSLLREVAYSPVMATYLTYRGNKAYSSAGTFPDENFAREIMQLFTIGLVKLKLDGGAIVPEEATYNNDDIMDFARVWTGFDFQPRRGNVETTLGAWDDNYLDPLQIKPNWRDQYPKQALDATYLGDRVPLCSDMPTRAFLTVGARFVYLGGQPAPRWQEDDGAVVTSWLTLNAATSALHQALCTPAAAGGACTYKSEVTLTANLACDGDECLVESARVVKVVGGDGVVTYFEYVQRPCVHFAFYNDAKQIKRWRRIQCADPKAVAAGAACCDTASQWGLATDRCTYPWQRMKFAAAEAYCAANGQLVCELHSNTQGACGYTASGKNNVPTWPYTWLSQPCSVMAQVEESGRVGIVHQSPSALTRNHQVWSTLAEGHQNLVRVLWGASGFPRVADSCGGAAGCSVTGSTCLCSTSVTESAVFATQPTRAQILSELTIGAPDPASKGYSKCATAACAAVADVDTFTSPSSGGAIATDTIFGVVIDSETVFLSNKLSTVSVGGGAFSFRNAPSFHLFSEPASRDASHETEALLHHLVHHKNTAPFMARRLIQRFVSSNPSPRYVRAVADAFRSGSYWAGSSGGYTGKYGDLGAALAATLLDREAESTTLDLDPSHGRLREPLLKVMHLMRSMGMSARHGREIELRLQTWGVGEDRIGQQVFQSPTVFSFYESDFQPLGPLEGASLVAPEFQLGTAPYVVGMLNGLFSLISYGLTSCHKGFGTNVIGRRCATTAKARDSSDGALAFTPSATSSSGVIDELDLLLTGGRLNIRTKGILASAYASKLAATSDASEALRTAMSLLVASAEFHATNLNSLLSVPRTLPQDTPSLGRPYKAVIVLMLNGGADSFNMLVPKSGCGTSAGGDTLVMQYGTMRAHHAIKSDSLLSVNAASGTQPCSTFGLHPKLGTLKAAYDVGDAAFIANIGTLVEPITKADVRCKAPPCKQVPPALFAHNTQQTRAYNVHAQNANAKGVVGRIVDALSSQASPYRTRKYSLKGLAKILEGSTPPDVLGRDGIETLAAQPELGGYLSQMGDLQSESLFAETFMQLLNQSIEYTGTMGALVDNVSTTNAFAPVVEDGDTLSPQFKQASKLIKLRTTLQTERDFFFTELGGFDTHNDEDGEELSERLTIVDGALASLQSELKAQGVWGSTAVVVVSDFGRTLTPNARGTDHGWGGNTFVIGGAVKGGQMLGSFPSTFEETDAGYVMSKGRMIPTTPWEGLWHAIGQWVGVSEANLKGPVLPNHGRFAVGSTLLTAAQLFE